MARDRGNTGRPPKAVIWDMDGVIADTGAAHFAAWRQIMAELGRPFDEADFRRIFGLVNPDAIRLLLGKTVSSHEIARISERKETGFREAVRVHVSLLPGVKTWLERLRQQGYRQAIASSAPRANIEVLLHVLDIGPYFQATVSADDVTKGKPDPAIFLKAAAALGVSPARCVVVEDAVAGVQAARRAGMVCLAVTTTQPEERLSGANLVVKSLTELTDDAFERLLTLRSV
ncbi:MAG: HAD family phosphatase [Anaerolineae bacterium]|nr:HAD family phosphatase [Anaerolineae bacterium]